MRHEICIEAFDTSAALAVLDGMVHQPTACLTPSAGPAWESAWIACLTNSTRWAETARQEFGTVLRELEAVVWFDPDGRAGHRAPRRVGADDGTRTRKP